MLFLFFTDNDTIYWVDMGLSTISRAKRDQTWREDVVTNGIGRVEGIAVDWIAGERQLRPVKNIVCVTKLWNSNSINHTRRAVSKFIILCTGRHCLLQRSREEKKSLTVEEPITLNEKTEKAYTDTEGNKTETPEL